jgi:hypothetical protein
MSSPEIQTLLTSGQVAAVLHKSPTTIALWAKNGKLEAAARIHSGRGVYLFDPEVVKQKALELALGETPQPTLDDVAPVDDVDEPTAPPRRRRRRAS